MRASFLSLTVALLVVIPCGIRAHAQSSAPSPFTTNLALGSSGAQVVALQQILNRDPATRVADAGPGSPGNETGYFGALTQSAVMRFQEKYASEVLTPAGLARGSGYVGLYTRAKLNALSAVAVNAGSVSPSAAPPTIATPSTPAASATASQNPNLQNLDTFLSDINTVAIKQGLSTTTIATIKSAVIKEAATTTNLRAAFLKSIPDNSGKPTADASLGGRALAAVEQLFNAVFEPQHARAALGTPFGGPLVYAFFCACSDTWLIGIGPLPPTYVTLLTYVPFTQAYLSYNIPATNWLLGEYAPYVGACYIPTPFGCPNIPSEGMIMPTVGSSPG